MILSKMTPMSPLTRAALSPIHSGLRNVARSLSTPDFECFAAKADGYIRNGKPKDLFRHMEEHGVAAHPLAVRQLASWWPAAIGRAPEMETPSERIEGIASACADGAERDFVNAFFDEAESLTARLSWIMTGVFRSRIVARVLRPFLMYEKCADLFNDYASGLDEDIPDDVMERIIGLARRYAGKGYTDPASVQEFDAVIDRGRLQAIVRHPFFLKDPIAPAVLGILSSLKEAHLWLTGMYISDCKNDRYYLRADFGCEQVRGVLLLIENDALWKEGDPSMRSVFFGEVARALALLSETSPNETFRARLKLMERSLKEKEGGIHEIDSHLVISFSGAEDRRRLRQVVEHDLSFKKDGQLSPLARLCQDILDGKYDKPKAAVR